MTSILSRLYQSTFFTKGYTLKNMRLFCKHLGLETLPFPTIHVAGTNGKGSVSLKVASALTFSGYKTGLYTSPHVTSFRERINIDGQWISLEDFLRITEKVFSIEDS